MLNVGKKVMSHTLRVGLQEGVTSVENSCLLYKVKYTLNHTAQQSLSLVLNQEK